MAAMTQAEAATVRRVGRAPCARWSVVLAGLTIGALVMASGVVLVVRSDERRAALDARSAATVRAGAAAGDLAQPVGAARAALARSAGQVDDERARTDLAVALDEALAASRVGTTTPGEMDRATTRLVAGRNALVRATAAVGASVARWQVAQAQAAWVAAAGRLDGAIAAARDVLSTSIGQVADDAVRGALVTAIGSAQAVRQAVEPTDVPRLTSATTALAGAAQSLVAAQAAVIDAVASWQQAHAALAAGAAPPQVAVTKKPTPVSGPAATTPATSGVSHWETTVTYEDLAVCGDEFGNWWYCDP